MVQTSETCTPDKQSTTKNGSPQLSSAQPAPPVNAQQIPPKTIPERFEEPSVPVTPQSQSRVNNKQQNGPTLPSHEDSSPSTSPAKNPSLFPPTPAPTPSPAVPGAEPPTTLNLKRQRCQDPFAYNSSEEDEGVVLVNVPRKRRHIDQNEGAGEDGRSQTSSISTVATPPSQPPDTQLSSTTSQSAASEVIEDVKEEKQITSTREIIDLDQVEQEDMGTISARLR